MPNILDLWEASFNLIVLIAKKEEQASNYLKIKIDAFEIK